MEASAQPWPDEENVNDGGSETGNVPAPYVPPIPRTSEDFAELLSNPALPPEQQAAPPQELLNPHLFK